MSKFIELPNQLINTDNILRVFIDRTEAPQDYLSSPYVWGVYIEFLDHSKLRIGSYDKDYEITESYFNKIKNKLL